MVPKQFFAMVFNSMAEAKQVLAEYQGELVWFHVDGYKIDQLRDGRVRVSHIPAPQPCIAAEFSRRFPDVVVAN